MMRFIMLFLTIACLPTLSTAEQDENAWMDTLITRVDALLEEPLPDLEAATSSKHKAATVISPAGDRPTHVWVYQLAAGEAGSAKLYARLRPFQDINVSRPVICDYEFNLGAREARYLLGLANRALYCEKSPSVRAKTLFPRPCLSKRDYPKPVCIGGSTSIVRIITEDDEDIRMASACGADDETGHFVDAIKTFAHPHYHRPNASCEQNRTPENLINTPEE